MNKNENIIEDLKNEYQDIRKIIMTRLDEFRRVWDGRREENIFAELIFCLLTPQSKAKLCWNAVKNICEENLLLNCNRTVIKHELNSVRFKNKKTEFVINAYRKFIVNGKVNIRATIEQFSNPMDAREWLVQNVLGLGYKEASHFLRNIGFCNDLAILDRHILKNLKLFGVIDEIPESISKRRYLDIEKKMKEFANQIDIPLSHLDLLFWYKETGEVFK